MSEQVTPLYPPSIKPARRGVYMVEVGECDWYSMWDGRRWLLTSFDPQDASRQAKRSYDCYSQKFRGWRGLAQPPKE